MNLAQLNQDYGLSGTVQFAEGKGGLPYIEVTNDQAIALISVYGGQVLAYKPQDVDRDLLFVSPNAYYQSGKAIKGGAPICWPWFGPDPEDQGRPSHGFVRNRLWQVKGTQALPSGATQVTLALSDTDETRALWPHSFELVLEITIGRTLELILTSHNLGDRPFDITQAVHTYFTVGDISQTSVLGLDGTTYIDKVDNQRVKPQSGPVTVTQEVDRIYQSVPNELMIDDRALSRCVRITSTGNQTAVVWNPWIEVSAKSGDLTDDAYQHFICVETTNAADDVVTVPAQGAYRLSVIYDLLTQATAPLSN
jgi:glucose-6-phosphate 1-epimerase